MRIFKSTILLSLILLMNISINFAVFSDGSGDGIKSKLSMNNKELKKRFDDNYKKWKTLNVEKYYMKIKYGAFSPISGVWEIYVENDSVVKWVIDGKVNPSDMKEAVSGITMERLFRIAKSCYMAKDGDEFIITVTYDERLNFIRSLSRIRNPNSKNASNDKTFRYEILDFKIL
jgi:hypothetical protein